MQSPSSPLTRRHFLGLLVGAGATTLLAACSSSSAPASSGGAATSAPAAAAPTSAPAAAAPTSAPAAAATSAPAAAATTAPAAGSTSAPAAGATTAAGPAKSLSGKVVIGAFPDPTEDIMKPILDDWGKKNNVQVVWEEQPYSTFYEKALNDAQSKSGVYDIYNLDDPWVPIFGGGGFLVNLTKAGITPNPDLQQNSLDLGYWPPKTGPRVPGPTANDEPQLYAIPWIGDVTLGVWRSDVFSKEPETWDEVLAVAKQKTDASKQQYGFVTTGQKGNPIVSNWYPILLAFGSDIFDDKWNVIINNDKGVKALQFLLDLRQYMPDGMPDFTLAEEYAVLYGDQAPAAVTWTGFCKDSDDPSKSKAAGKFNFAPPFKQEKRASGIGLWIGAVSASAKNPDAAIELMKFWASSEAQIAYARAGGTPVTRTAYEDKEAVSKARWLPGILASLDVAQPRPRTPEWAKIEDIVGTHTNEALVAKGGAKEALDAAATEIHDLMQSMKYYG